MKYNTYSKMIKLFIKRPIYKCLRERVPGLITSDYKKRSNKEYRAIIERTEGVGGTKNNPLEIILIFIAFPIALYKCSEGRIDDDTFEAMIISVSESKIMKWMSKSVNEFSDKTITTYRKSAEMSQHREYKNDWVSEFEYKEGSEEYFNTYRECGICKITEQEGVFHIAKHFCKMDYPMFKHKGLVLDRTKTIAYGDDYCNFHVMSKEKAKKIGFVEGKDAK